MGLTNEGLALIEALKNRQHRHAVKHLSAGAELNLADENGCVAMHYAAAEGYTDLVTMMMELGGKVNIPDNICQTPLHKAAIGGHSQTIMVLLAFGAYIHARDKEGYTPLEMAVRWSRLKAAETLLTFGADAGSTSIDLSFTETSQTQLSSKHRKLFDLLHAYSPLSAALKSGGMICETNFVLPGVYQPFHNINGTAWLHGETSPFLMLMKKTQVEYTNMDMILAGRQRPFSDKYECVLLKPSNETQKTAKVNFSLTIDCVPARNESLVLVTMESKASLRSADINRTLKQTIVEVSMICKNENNVFALVTEESEEERVSILNKNTTVRPSMEPDAEIYIEKGTFDMPTDLTINVFDCDMSDHMLMQTAPLSTTLLSINTSNDHQLRKEVEITIPVKVPEDESDGMCVLATSKDNPQTVEDWEVMDADISDDGKGVCFRTQHLSIFTPVRKSDIEKDINGVVDALHAARRSEKKVIFAIYIRFDSNKRGRFELVVEVTSPRKESRELRENFWKKDGFIKHNSNTSICTVNSMQNFIIKVKGNVHSQNKNVFTVLRYDGKRGAKSILLELEVSNSSPAIDGIVLIEKEMEFVEIVEKVIPQSGIFCSKNMLIKESVVRKVAEKLLEIPMKLEIPVEDQIEIFESNTPDTEGNVPVPDDDILEAMATEIEIKYPSTIPGYTAQILATIASQIDSTKLEPLRTNLMVNETDFKKMMDNSNTPAITALQVLLRYRGKRPHVSQVTTIQSVLRGIGAEDLALLLPDTKDLR